MASVTIAFLRSGRCPERWPTRRLFSSGALDSVAMFNLIAFLEETAGIEVRPEAVTLDNFDTAEAILRFSRQAA